MIDYFLLVCSDHEALRWWALLLGALTILPCLAYLAAAWSVRTRPHDLVTCVLRCLIFIVLTMLLCQQLSDVEGRKYAVYVAGFQYVGYVLVLHSYEVKTQWLRDKVWNTDAVDWLRGLMNVAFWPTSVLYSCLVLMLIQVEFLR